LVQKDSIVDDDPEKYLVIYPPIATNQQGFFAATAKKKGIPLLQNAPETQGTRGKIGQIKG